MDLKKAVSIVLTSTLLLSMLLIAVPKAYAQTTIEYVPSISTITTLNQEFTVSCMVNNVADLAGFDLQIAWDTAYIQYVSHTATAENILNPMVFYTKDVVDDPGLGPGTYWIAAATLGGAGFDGSGQAFIMTFRAINVPIGPLGDYFDTLLVFTNHDLADSAAQPIDHTAIDGIVRIYYREEIVPPVPMLKVTPAVYEAGTMGENFPISVWLMGAGEADLDPYWDVAGIDVYLNFDPVMIEALSVTLDPAGTFAAFWPNGIYELAVEIDNVAGYVHVAYMGIPGHMIPNHIKPYGKINMFTVTFAALTEGATYPPASSAITLKNPLAFTGSWKFNSIGGLFNLATPLGTDWHEIVPAFSQGPYDLSSWEDNGDGKLSVGDQVILDGPGGYYFDYYIDAVKGALELEHLYTAAKQTYIWVASFGADNLANNFGATLGGQMRYIGTDDPYDGFGTPYWTGNFTMAGLSGVSQITVHALPFTGDEYTYTLVEGVDYLVHADDDLIELLTPVDVDIINEEWTDGVDNTLNGWPYINYVASGIQSVFVDMHNGTARYGINNGYSMPPPSEWWYDPDYTWELEGWWALGYFPGPWVWPAGSTWWINYTAASYLEVDYLTEPEGIPRFIEYQGTYDEFMGILAAPVGTMWDEAYYKDWLDHTIVDWNDVNTNTLLDAGDEITTQVGANFLTFRVTNPAVDIHTLRKPWICEDSPTDAYFGWAPIVTIAGFPQPDQAACPWHNKEYSVPLPHVVANGVYVEPFKPMGGFIDVYVCNYPAGFKGEGLNKPADMFWPQKQVMLCANVTYAGWPEQNKDVAFEIKFPNGTVFVVMYARTNEYGVATVPVRLPWPCDDPEAIFGVWKVWATVDVACIVVNDTMEFKYDYRVRIFDVVANKDAYKHCEDIVVTITYGTYSMQTFNITFTLTVTDASGVPIGFAYLEVTIGGAVWCQYAMGELELSVHVVKWARPPIGTIYVGALSDFPQNGGSAETPVYITQVAILAEWA